MSPFTSPIVSAASTPMAGQSPGFRSRWVPSNGCDSGVVCRGLFSAGFSNSVLGCVFVDVYGASVLLRDTLVIRRTGWTWKAICRRFLPSMPRKLASTV